MIKQLCLALLGVAAITASAPGADWNQWRGPNRSGLASDSPTLISKLPEEGLRPVWVSQSIPSGNQGGWGSPIVAGGKVYLFVHMKKKLIDGPAPKKKFPWLPPAKRVGMTAQEYAEYERKRRDEDQAMGRLFDFRELIYCFDAATGKPAWTNERKSVYSRFLQSGSPAVIDGKLYILGAGRKAHCVDARTGKDVWTASLPGEFRDQYMMSSFAVADGVAVALCGHLFGLDAATGKILWQGNENDTRGTHSSPVTWQSGGKQYIVCNVAGSDTICLEPRSGRELWRVKSEANLSTPLIVGDRLITFGNSRKKGLRCFKISPSGAKPQWVFQRVADKGSSPVAVNGYVYVQGERRLACVDLETGRAAWQTTLDLGRPQYTSLVAVDDKVIYALEGLLMFAASSKGFRPLVDGKFNRQGLLASEAAHRRRLNLDELEKQPGGLETALKIYQQNIGSQGPLVCATPAVADGQIFLRTKTEIVCYDLRQSTR